MLERSVLGLIYSFNMLSASTVAVSSVKSFQRRLQNATKKHYKQGMVEWDAVLRTGVREFEPAGIPAIIRVTDVLVSFDLQTLT